jgi:hypothetical protein
MKERLASVGLYVVMEGSAWGGFRTERDMDLQFYGSGAFRWPGMKEAIRRACSDWGDVESDSVRPFYVQMQFNMRADDGDKVYMRHVVRQFDDSDLARMGVA